MANPSVVINNVIYASCPEVDIPKQGGGTAKFYYTGDADASATDILTGKTAFGASGTVNGSMASNGDVSGSISTKAGSVTVPAGYTTGGTVALDSSAITDLVSGSILYGKTILGVSGSLVMPTISQDSTTKILTIS